MPELIRHVPTRMATVTIRIPGEVKNNINDASTQAGLSLNAWILAAIQTALLEGLPTPPDPRPMPTAADVISDYLHGEQTLAPCGKAWPCEGEYRELSGTTWCITCGIRTI